MEQQLQIKPRPFVAWCVGIFVLCFLSLFAFLRPEPVSADRQLLAGVIWAAVSAVVALGGAFVACGLAAACRAFASGKSGLVDLVEPGLFLVAVVLYLVGYSLLPRVTGAIELSVWGFVLVMWLADRHVRARQSRATPPR